jgi:hypothetical protein
MPAQTGRSEGGGAPRPDSPAFDEQQPTRNRLALVNPFTFLTWLWKALLGHSVTFAALLGFGVLGLSVMQWLRAALGAIGVNWLGLLLIPMIVLTLLVRKERDWLPELERRKRWSRSIVGGALALAALVHVLKPDAPENASQTGTGGAGSGKTGSPSAVRPRGPSGK